MDQSLGKLVDFQGKFLYLRLKYFAPSSKIIKIYKSIYRLDKTKYLCTYKCFKLIIVYGRVCVNHTTGMYGDNTWLCVIIQK